VEMTLPQHLQLAANEVADAVHQAATRPPAIVLVATLPPTPPPTDHGTCYTPVIPDMPPTVIPGMPPTGDSSGTPDIVIPGTPSIPGSPYPCP
jgi:hypothetical protein